MATSATRRSSLALLLSVCVVPTPATGDGAPPRPNIVLLLADDLGWGDVGYHGSELVTPHIDRLASGGVQLDQFYVSQLCTPTRAALLTGRYPMRFGLQEGHIGLGSSVALPRDEVTLAEALKACGYETAIVGKWHLGHRAEEDRPTARGFDSQYGTYGSSINRYAHLNRTAPPRFSGWHRNEVPEPRGGSPSDLIADEAIEFLRRRDKAKPFFLYVPFTAPHVPIQPDEPDDDDFERYAHIDDIPRRKFAAVVFELDEAIGRIVSTLDSMDLKDNTLVVFASDNGAIHDGSNAPLRGNKAQLYEGGVRTPAFALWPGVLEPGAVLDEPILVVDLFPTFVGLAGGTTDRPLDGLDVWPTLTDGEPSPHDDFLIGTTQGASAVRRGRWKLIVHHEEPECVELFDVVADREEQHDVAGENVEVCADLRRRLDGYIEQAAPSLFWER